MPKKSKCFHLLVEHSNRRAQINLWGDRVSEFQSFDAMAKKALLPVSAHLISEGRSRQTGASKDYHSVQAGFIYLI